MEMIRRTVRKFIPYNSGIYRYASRAYNFGSVALKQGPRMAATLDRLNYASGGEPELLNFRGVLHPILARPGTPDSIALITTLVREDHGYIEPEVPPLTFLDAGAYIGDSAIYFLAKYPKVSVVALEPDPTNYEVISQNLKPYGERVKLLPKALSNRTGIVRFGGEYDGAAISDEGVEVEATTIPELMRAAGWERINLLKMDIEGAERFVLDESADEWLPLVDFLILEIHGPEIERAVRPTLKRNGFEMELFRTSWYCRRPR